MKKQTIFIILAAIIAGAAGILVQRYTAEPPPPERPLFTAPFSTQLPDLLDKPQRIMQWHGKILVINFWATWCPSCLTEIPEFITLQEQYADKNVQFIGIAVEDKPTVMAYKAKANINYPILIAGDSGMVIAKSWGNTADSIPFTIVLNPRGEIIYRHLGEINRDKLLEVIQPLLNLEIVSNQKRKALVS